MNKLPTQIGPADVARVESDRVELETIRRVLRTHARLAEVESILGENVALRALLQEPLLAHPDRKNYVDAIAFLEVLRRDKDKGALRVAGLLIGAREVTYVAISVASRLPSVPSSGA